MIITSIFLLIKYNYIYIYIKPESQQTITLSLLGGLTSFLGFLVVFVQISYENQKKIFGEYVKQILFNKTWKNLILIFSITVTFCLGASILKDEQLPYLEDLCFNLSVSGFILFFIFLITGVKSILNNSFSVTEIKGIITKIDLNTVEEQFQTFSREKFFDSVIPIYENNPISIINQVVKNSVANDDFRIIHLVVILMVEKYSYLLFRIKNKDLFDESSTWKVHSSEATVDSLINFFNSLHGKGLKYQSNWLASSAIISLKEIFVKMAVLGFNIEDSRLILNKIESLIKKCIALNKKDLILEELKNYSSCLIASLEHSIPKEEELDYFETNILNKDINRSKYDNIGGRQWAIISHLLSRDFQELISYCIEYSAKDDIKLAIDYLNVYKDVFNFIIRGNSILGEEQIFSLTASNCFFIFNHYRELTKNNNKNIYINDPFLAFEIVDILMEEKKYAEILANSWLSWFSFIIKHKGSRIAGFHELYSFINHILIKDKIDNFILEYLSAAIELYRVIYETYKDEIFETSYNVMSISLSSLDNIESRLLKNTTLFSKLILLVQEIKSLYNKQEVIN